MRKLLITLVVVLVHITGSTAQDGAVAVDWSGTPQEAFLNSEMVQTFQCTSCHTITDRGGTVGPILNHIAIRRSREWLMDWLKDPQTVKPGTKMPKFDFTPGQLTKAVDYLSSMKKELHADEILSKDIPLVEQGELLFEDYDCLACHRVGSSGRFVGPDLTWVGVRKSEEWEKIWLADPPAFKPATFMPNLHIPQKGTQALAAFLRTQQGQKNAESQQWEFRANFFLGNDDRERGELVFKRLACWACHGETGAGGVKNPNMAPHEIMPPLTEAAVNYTQEELLERLKKKTYPKALDDSKPNPPFYCPDYANYLEKLEYTDLYAYLNSLAPKKRKWRFQ